jgi:UDP-N-acetylmuramoyl-tripeptide--D-alanyl-D-alanine ligase
VVLASGAVVINDCYNANPLSMRAALDDLATQEPVGRRIAVLGDMLELGTGEADAHRAVGEEAARAGVDVLVAVGPLARGYADGARGVADHWAPTVDEAAATVRAVLAPGDVVLVKGSRAMGLEAVAEALTAVPVS